MSSELIFMFLESEEQGDQELVGEGLVPVGQLEEDLDLVEDPVGIGQDLVGKHCDSVEDHGLKDLDLMGEGQNPMEEDKYGE